MKRKETLSKHRFIVTSDCVIFGFDGHRLYLLLTIREKEPFANQYALPGGMLFENETSDECAKRVLLEKTGISNVFTEQLYSFSDTNRDPRERVISVAYYALVNMKDFELIAGRATLKSEWKAVTDLPELAFDHTKIVDVAIERLKNKIRYQALGFELLNEKFTLPQFQTLYEAVVGESIDRRNFRKKILSSGLLIQLKEKEKNVSHKAATYYRFDKKKYKEFSKQGFQFEL